MAVRRSIRITGPWALLLGVALLGFGIYQLMVSSTLAAEGVVANAVVVDVDSRLRDGRRTYALTLEYQDQSGQMHRERTGYSRTIGHRSRGTTVPILYNPADPTEFSLNSWYQIWALPFGLLAGGVVACGAFLFGPRSAA